MAPPKACVREPGRVLENPGDIDFLKKIMTPAKCNLEVTQNPAFLTDPPPYMSKSMRPTDFSPELDIMIFHRAGHGIGHFCIPSTLNKNLFFRIKICHENLEN